MATHNTNIETKGNDNANALSTKIFNKYTIYFENGKYIASGEEKCDLPKIFIVISSMDIKKFIFTCEILSYQYSNWFAKHENYDHKKSDDYYITYSCSPNSRLIMEEILEKILKYMNVSFVLKCAGCDKISENLENHIQHKKLCPNLWILNEKEKELNSELKRYSRDHNSHFYLINRHKGIMYTFENGKFDAKPIPTLTLEGTLNKIHPGTYSTSIFGKTNVYMLVGTKCSRKMSKHFMWLIEKII